MRLADKLAEVSFQAFLVNLPDVRLAVMLHKFIRGPGHAVLVTFSGDAGVRVCDGDKEVRGCLPIGWLVSHVDEVFASKRGWTVADHLTLVDDMDSVEEIVNA